MDALISLFPLDMLGAVALACVFLSMLGLGAGTNPRTIRAGDVATAALWAPLAVALVAVPVAALGLASAFSLTSGPLVGLLLMGISPGAPLALRRAREGGAKHPFALTLQVTVALASIVAVPLWLLVLSGLYGRPAGISLGLLARQVFVAQILPLGLGIGLAAWRPAAASRAAPLLLRGGSLLLLAVGVLLLVHIGPALAGLPATAILASVLLASAAIGLGHWAGGRDRQRRIASGAIAAMRNPGMALLVSTANGLPAGSRVMIVCHALVTAVMLGLYLAWMGSRHGSSGP